MILLCEPRASRVRVHRFYSPESNVSTGIQSMQLPHTLLFFFFFTPFLCLSCLLERELDCIAGGRREGSAKNRQCSGVQSGRRLELRLSTQETPTCKPT